jgi:glycosyltransferase involved in cell wall biosynthesis
MIKLCVDVQAEAPILMSGARAFVFPSAYEGFGLPIIEAMACGTPVITTRHASIPEIAGDSALYCDDNDPKDLAEKIGKIIQDGSFRDEYVQRGLARAKIFTWEKAGEKTLKVVSEWGA